MKKFRRFLTILITMAIMAGMLVMPVTAESVNYLESRNWNFEADSLNTNTKISNASYEIVTPESNKGTAGDRVLLVTPSGTSNAKVKDEWVTWGRTDIVPGKTYRFSYDIRTVASGTTTSARVKLESASPSSNTMTIDGDGSNNYYTGAYVSSIGNEWTTVSGEFKLENTSVGATEYKGFHATADIGNGSTAAVYLDNFRIEEVIPALTVTSEFSGDKNALPLEGSYITYTFNRAPSYEITVADFTTNAPVTGVEKVSETVYRLNFNTLADGGTYNVELTVNDSVNTLVYSLSFDAVSTEYRNINYIRDSHNWSFESATLPSTTDSYNSNNAYEFSIVSDGNATNGSKVLLVDFVNPEAAASSRVKADMRFNYVYGPASRCLKAGQTYRISYDIKTANSAAVVKSRILVSQCAPSSNTIIPGVVNRPEFNITNEWTTVTGTFTIIENVATGTYQGIHIGAEILGAESVYIDNFVLEDVVPELTYSCTLQDGTSDVEPNTEFVYTFSNEIKEFSEENVVLKKGTARITDGITLTKLDEKTYKVELSELDTSSAYSVAISGVKDMWSQYADEDRISFVTTSSANILALQGINYSFEKDTSYGAAENGAKVEFVTFEDTRVKAFHGDRYIKVSERASSSAMQRFYNVGGAGYAQPFEAGKTYLISFRIRTAARDDGDGTTDKARVHYSQAAPAYSQSNPKPNSILPGTPESNKWIDIDNNSWKEIRILLPVVSNTTHGAPEGTELINQGIHIGFETIGNTTVYVDNYVVKEYFPEFTVDFGFEDGAEGILAENINVEFSNAPVSFDASNVSIDGGAAVKGVTKNSDTKYSVALSGFGYETTYNLRLSGVYDTYGQLLDKSVQFTTSASNILDGMNFFSEIGFNWHFEGADGSTAKTNYTDYKGVSRTVNIPDHSKISTEEAYTGASSLKVASLSQSDYLNRSRFIYLPVKDNTSYYISAWVKLDEAGARSTAKLSCDTAGGTNTKLTVTQKASAVDISGDEWTNVTGIINVKYTGNAGEDTVHIGVRSGYSGEFYMDDFAICEIPQAEFEIAASSPSDKQNGVYINCGEITLNYSHPLSDGVLTANDYRLFAGDTDVSSEVIKTVSKGFGNSSVIIALEELENNTEYTVKAASVKSFAGYDSTAQEIHFKTSDTVVSDSVSVTASGVSANVTNVSAETVKMPVLVYTIYNEQTGELVSSGISEKTGALTPWEVKPITLTYGSIPAGCKAYGYVLKAYDNVDVISSTLTEKAENVAYDIDADNETITVYGRAVADSHIVMALLDGETIIHFTTVKAESDGSFSKDLPVAAHPTENRVYRLVTTGGSLDSRGDGSDVYVPSDATITEAKNAINNASDSAELCSAIEMYNKVFGIDISDSVYVKYSAKIANAIFVMNGGSDYTEFADKTNSASFIYHYNKAFEYYERQAKALSEINSADADKLTEILNAYADVLGVYGGTKLDFNQKYTTYGALAVNRLLVGNAYNTMDDFVAEFNRVQPQTISSPESGRPSGGGGGGGGVGASVPTAMVKPQDTTSDLFSDINASHWAWDGVLELVNRGIINGMGDGTFAPDGNVTREQFIKMLVLLYDLPKSAGKTQFSDVDENAWYAPYVAAACEQGIINGISKDEFGVGMNITRQDLVTIIVRCSDISGLKLEELYTVDFEDSGEISDYAYESVQRLARVGVITGITDTSFAPLSFATRAQVAVILNRLLSI